RRPWRHRSKRRGLKLTPTEKVAVAAKKMVRRSKRAAVMAEAQKTISGAISKVQTELGGHDFQYYQTEVMQQQRKVKTQRAPNRWNAYLMKETKSINDALPDGQPRRKASELVAEIRERWNKMSLEERLEATKESIEELKEQREMRAVAPHNTAISTFHDTHITIDTVHKMLEDLNACTDVEIVMFVVRGNSDHYNHPSAFTTSERANEFFPLAVNCSVPDLLVRFESFCLSGVRGAAAKASVARMYYMNFDMKITAKYGVVIENWPLDRFLPPSHFKSKLELEVLLKAWESDSTRFRKLSTEEFERWRDTHIYHESTIDASMPTMPPSSVAPPVVPSGTSTSRKRTRNSATLHDVVNVVGTAAGTAVPIVKKPRAPRSDKGKPR
ncbi:hypothetical protein OBBRIDRAFT_699789, partial [Obba rivulosa]